MNFFNSEVFRYLNKGKSKILMYVKDSEHTKRLRDIQGNFAEAPLRSPMLGRCGVRDCWCLFLLRKSSIHHPYQTSNFGPEFSTKVFHSSATKHNTKHWTFTSYTYFVILWFPPSNWRMKWSFRSLQNTATIWKNNICKI